MININLNLEKKQAEFFIYLLKQITDEQICDASWHNYPKFSHFETDAIYSIVNDIENQFNNKKDLKFRIGQKGEYNNPDIIIYGLATIVDITIDGKYVIEYQGNEWYGDGTNRETLTEEELLQYNKQ